MLSRWIGERWSESGDDAIESCRALRVGFYCICRAVSRRCLDLLIDFEFAVGVGNPVLFPIGGLQLIVEIVGLRLKTGGSLKVSDRIRRLPLVQQDFSQLILCIEVVWVRSDDLPKHGGSLLGL